MTFQTKISSLIFTFFNRLENNNNAEFATNGEAEFVRRYFSLLKGPVCLFDVGGNIGDYAQILRAESTQRGLSYAIHVFEPTRSCFSVLQQKFPADKGVVLNNVGASDAAGNATIYYDQEKSGFASLYQRDLSSVNVRMEQRETIRLIRLEDYIREQSLDRIDLFKIDIEGHELAAFRGLGRYLSPSYISAIQFEYGGANIDSRTTLRDLYSILTEAGFVIGKIMKHGVELRPYSSRMENYQYANYVALAPDAARSFR